MTQPTTYLLVYITYPDELTARRITRTLIEERLIAGANIMSANSEYHWQGAVQQAGEYAAMAQSTYACIEALNSKVEELHPYQIPCISYFEARANAAYVAWVHDQTRPE